MLIRRAAAADATELTALVARYWEFEGIEGFVAERLRPLVERLIAEPALGACWVLAADARLVGYLAVTRVYSLEQGGVMAEVDEFYVAPEARAAGGGTRLLAAAEAALSAEGCPRLQLQLGVGNEPAREFYSRRGYRRRAGYELWDKPLAPDRGAGGA